VQKYQTNYTPVNRSIVNSVVPDQGLKSAAISRQMTKLDILEEPKLDKLNSMASSILKTKSLLNFESKLDKDLQDTTQSLINHMKNHSLLSK
jgi:hypothetical protein